MVYHCRLLLAGLTLCILEKICIYFVNGYYLIKAHIYKRITVCHSNCSDDHVLRSISSLSFSPKHRKRRFICPFPPSTPSRQEKVKGNGAMPWKGSVQPLYLAGAPLAELANEKVSITVQYQGSQNTYFIYCWTFSLFFFLIQIVILYSCISRVEHSLCLFNSPIQQKSVLQKKRIAK